MRWGICLMFMAAVFMTGDGQNTDAETGPSAAEITAKVRRLPGLDVCGTSVVPLGSRVINGEPAKLGAYPWMASLGYVIGINPRLYWECGGSLITDQYVITAAHCITYARTRPYRFRKIRLGELDLNETVADGASPQDFEYEKLIPHKDYLNYNKINDLGLIRLKEKVKYSALIKPICLPLPEFSQDMYLGYRPIVAGWGRSTNNYTAGVKDTRLLEADVAIQDTEACRSNVTLKLTNVIIDDNVICASSDGRDACKGDSGGPLMFFANPTYSTTNNTGNMFLMGVVSYGYLCAQPGYPGVYMRAAKFMDWIVDKIDI